MTLPPSDHFNGKTFFNPGHENRSWLDVLRWQFNRHSAPWPKHVPLTPFPLPPAPRAHEWLVTLIGHATFLIQTPEGNFLTDPHFSDRCGPFGLLGPRRVQPPALTIAALPHIDAILLSHDHYDHCDLASLRALARRFNPQVIAPLAHRKLLRRAGLERIVELDWWQSHALDSDLSVTLTPARHWSNRLSGTRNTRLWGGFFVRHPGRAWWFSGDTGYDAEFFRAIRTRLGAPALAMIPIGAYEPRWFMAAQHCNPAEAVQIHQEIGAGFSLGMHWGTWRLTDEGRDDPVRALAEARASAGVAATAFRAAEPGEPVRI